MKQEERSLKSVLKTLQYVLQYIVILWYKNYTQFTALVNYNQIWHKEFLFK